MKVINWWTKLWVVCLVMLLIGCVRPEGPQVFDAALSDALEVSIDELKEAALTAQDTMFNETAQAIDAPEDSSQLSDDVAASEDSDQMLITYMAFTPSNRAYLADTLNIPVAQLETALDSAVQDYAQGIGMSNSALQDEVDLSLANYQLKNFVRDYPITTMPSLFPMSDASEIIDAYVTKAIQEGVIQPAFGDYFRQLDPCGYDFRVNSVPDSNFILLPDVDYPICFEMPVISFEPAPILPKPPCDSCMTLPGESGTTQFTSLAGGTALAGGVSGPPGSWQYGKGYVHRRDETKDCGGQPRLTVFPNAWLSITVYGPDSSRIWHTNINADQVFTFCGYYQTLTVSSDEDYVVDSSLSLIAQTS